MKRVRLERWLNRVWYTDTSPPGWLVPLSWLYGLVIYLRRLAVRAGSRRVVHPGVATIVVGNITVGGTGKTPLVIALSDCLSAHGWRTGIVTRGYGGKARDWPREVFADSRARENGDEAVLLAQSTGAPVYAGPDRLAAARALLAKHPVDVLISDDGLQHTRLGRDIEIVVLDPERGFGNGYCLPAGPLREPLSRLDNVDATVAPGEAGECSPAQFQLALRLGGECSPAQFQLALRLGEARQVIDQSVTRVLADFARQPCHAVAGIAHPERFFRGLRRAGVTPDTRVFADHHDFTAEDIRFEDDFPVLMTAKDAVKCRDFAGENVWFVPLELDVGPAFGKWLYETLKRKTDLG